MSMVIGPAGGRSWLVGHSFEEAYQIGFLGISLPFLGIRGTSVQCLGILSQL